MRRPTSQQNLFDAMPRVEFEAETEETFLEVDADEANPEHCGLCGGEGLRMGALGALVWHRCRSCGSEFSTLDLEVQ